MAQAPSGCSGFLTSGCTGKQGPGHPGGISRGGVAHIPLGQLELLFAGSICECYVLPRTVPRLLTGALCCRSPAKCVPEVPAGGPSSVP